MIEVLLAASLLRQIVAAEEQQNAVRMQYECRELQENWEAAQKDATLQSKRYDVVLLEGSRYRKLVERNGAPIDAQERRLVEDDMLRTAIVRRSVKETMRGERLADLERTHELSIEGNELVAAPKSSGRAYRLTFDPRTHALLRYVRDDGDMRLTMEYSPEGGIYLMRRMTVEFVAGVRRVQQSSFEAYRPAQ